MASSIIHMAVAKKINEKLDYEEKNLLLGSIAPDIAKQLGKEKYTTHFFPKDDKKEYPNINEFLEKYKSHLRDPFVMGYFIHLYTDLFWFKDFMGEVMDDKNIYLLNNDIIMNTKENYKKEVYLDYFSINKGIIDKYNMDLSLFYEQFEIKNKYIKEIDNNELYKIIESAGLSIINSKISNYKVFNLENVSNFIEMSSKLIYSKIKDLLKEKDLLIAISILNIRSDIEKIKKIDKTSTDYIHLDIMDGKFVPNKCEYINKIDFNKKVDIHLMVEDVVEYVNKYKDYKPEFITFHYESNENKIWDLIKYISNYSKVGIAINPSTDIDNLIPYLDDIDLVLVMSVKAGMGGQKFIDISDKINKLIKLRKENNYAFQIEVDGGLNIDTVNKCKDADILVIGSYITNSDNYERQILNIKNNLKK